MGLSPQDSEVVDGMISEGPNRGLFGHHRVTISPEDVTDFSDNSQTTTTWRGIDKIRAGDQHAYIYTNALAAIIVPGRAFTNRSDFEEFLRVAREYHERAVA